MTDEHFTYGPGIGVHPDLLIPFEGETIAASRYESLDREGPLPTVVVATPYRKDDRITFGSWDPSIQYFVTHGYDVVVMDLVGTGASSGDREPYSGTEGEEVARVIEWVADREWSTGRVGTFGLSYGAWTQYCAAVEDPDPLEAMVPVAMTPSQYTMAWMGGAFNLVKRTSWPAQMQATRALPPSRRDPDGRWADVWHDRLETLRDRDPWLFQIREHDTKDEYWQRREVDPDDVSVPTLAACGYRDLHTGPMIDFVEGIDAPKRMYVGPWRHNMPEQGRECAIDFRRQAVEWYDHFLKGEDNGARDHPTVRYWTERNGGWEPGEGTWRATERWATPADEAVSFALTPAGLARHGDTTFEPLELEYEHDHTVGMDSLLRTGSVVNTGFDTSADDARSVVFETDRLTTPVEFTGNGTASLRLVPTTEDPIVSVRVADVGPTGSAKLVTAGHLRASHRNGHEGPEPLTPGEEYTVDVPLRPKSHVFESGRRIRVAVSAANFPRSLSEDTQGAFILRSEPDDASVIAFAGREHETGTVSFDDTTTVSSPDDDAIPVSSGFVTPILSTCTTSRDPGTNTGTYRTRHEYRIDLPHGPEMRWENESTASVTANDPASASARNDISLTLAYPTEEVRVDTTARTARETQSIETSVRIDDHTVFEERWMR